MGICPLCNDTRHVRREGRWARCACMVESLSAAYIHPVLRGSDSAYPEPWDGREPLPMATQVFIKLDPAASASWDAFRFHVWRSLLAYEPRGITHDVVSFNRFSDIAMGQEKGDTDEGVNIRDLARLDILIVTVSAFNMANRLTRSVFGTLLEERENANRATWVFSHISGYALRNLLDEPIYRRWFAPSDAHPPLATVDPAPQPERPRAGAQPKPADPARGGRAGRYR